MFDYVLQSEGRRTDRMYIPLRSLNIFQGWHLVCDIYGRTQCTPYRLFHPEVKILQVFLIVLST